MSNLGKGRYYILEVQWDDGNSVSSEGYDSYEQIEKFILNRGDRPVKVGDYKFESETHRYLIHPVYIWHDKEEIKEKRG